MDLRASINDVMDLGEKGLAVQMSEKNCIIFVTEGMEAVSHFYLTSFLKAP